MVCKWFDLCPLRDHERSGLIDSYFRLTYCESKDNWKNCKRYQLESEGKFHEDELLPDGSFIE
jgi:uncharacterized protein YodC (DUF2158 family)